MKKLLIWLCLMFAGQFVLAQGFADESKDWNVPPKASPKGWPYTANTPLTVPGAKTLLTSDLKALLKDNSKLVLIDILGEKKMIPGALSLPGAGSAELAAPVKDKFDKVLSTLSRGDKAAPIVFYCHHSRCWWSYNAALHALAAGFTQVNWYRGGIDAWVASGGETVASINAPGW